MKCLISKIRESPTLKNTDNDLCITFNEYLILHRYTYLSFSRFYRHYFPLVKILENGYCQNFQSIYTIRNAIIRNIKSSTH